MNALDRISLKHLPQLEYLDVSANQLRRLRHLPSGLKTLNASHNQLVAVPALPPCLEWLNLSSNQLSQFTAVPSSLETLLLNDNALTELTLTGLDSLRHLAAAYNHLDTCTIANPLLTYLDLSNNMFTVIDLKPSLTALSTLLLSHNKLVRLPSITLASLTSADLAFNQLGELPVLLTKSIKLETLHLENNRLKVLPPEITQLSALHEIYLAENSLEKVPNMSIMSSLQILDFRENRLTGLPRMPAKETGDIPCALLLRGNPLVAEENPEAEKPPEKHHPPTGLLVDVDDEFEEIDSLQVEHSVEEMYVLGNTNRLLYEQMTMQLAGSQPTTAQKLVTKLLAQDNKELAVLYAQQALVYYSAAADISRMVTAAPDLLARVHFEHYLVLRNSRLMVMKDADAVLCCLEQLVASLRAQVTADALAELTWLLGQMSKATWSNAEKLQLLVTQALEFSSESSGVSFDYLSLLKNGLVAFVSLVPAAPAQTLTDKRHEPCVLQYVCPGTGQWECSVCTVNSVGMAYHCKQHAWSCHWSCYESSTKTENRLEFLLKKLSDLMLPRLLKRMEALLAAVADFQNHGNAEVRTWATGLVAAHGDVEVVVQDAESGVLHATQRVSSAHLSKRSEYFQGMLRADFKEAQEGRITVQVGDRDEADVFLLVIGYINSGFIDLQSELLVGIYQLAHRYQIKPLQDLAEASIVKTVPTLALSELIGLRQVADALSSKAITGAITGLLLQVMVNSFIEGDASILDEENVGELERSVEQLTMIPWPHLMNLLTHTVKHQVLFDWLMNHVILPLEGKLRSIADAAVVIPKKKLDGSNSTGFNHPWHAAHPVTCDGRDNGWRCDGVLQPGGCRRGMTTYNQSAGVPRYTCAECDFDLCDECMKVYFPNLPKHPYFPFPPEPLRKRRAVSVAVSPSSAGEPPAKATLISWDDFLEIGKAKQQLVIEPLTKAGKIPPPSLNIPVPSPRHPLFMACVQNPGAVRPLVLWCPEMVHHTFNSNEHVLTYIFQAIDDDSQLEKVLAPLLTNGAVASIPDPQFMSLLMKFLHRQGPTVAELFFKNGLDVNWRPLHLPPSAPRPQLTNHLRQYDPQRDINESLNAQSSPTLLHLVCGSPACQQPVTFLLQAKADPNAICPTRGTTPLHVAAFFGQGETCRVLLEAGANPNAVNHTGWSALHFAAFQSLPGHHAVVDYLLQHEAVEQLANTWEVPPNEKVPDGSFITPLGLASRTRLSPSICQLLSKGRTTGEGTVYTIEPDWGRQRRGTFARLFTRIGKKKDKR